MKVLINVLDLDKQGGVANYYQILQDKFTVDINYFIVGSRKPKTSNKTWFFRLIGDYFTFYNFLITNQFDIVVINPSFNRKSILRDSVFLIIAKSFKKPLVVFFRGWEKRFEQIIEKYFLSPFKSIFFKADAIITLGSEFKKKLEGWGYSKKIFLETTAVDDGLLGNFNKETILKKFSRPDGKFTILFLTRVEKYKGIFEVIETFKILNKRYTHVELIVAGEGSCLHQIKLIAAQEKLENIKFTGHVINGAKKELYEQADLYFFPTYGEGMPNSLLEALAFGLPVITCPVGGIIDFFENGKMGFYTDGLVPEKMALQIERLINDQQLRQEISLYNHEYAHKNFLASDVALRLENIYQQVMESV